MHNIDRSDVLCLCLQRVADSHAGAEHISQPVQQPEVVLTVAIHHPFRVTAVLFVGLYSSFLIV